MYEKLKKFGMERESEKTMSSVWERLWFWKKKEKHRQQCLDQLHSWNKRLWLFIQSASKEPPGGKVLPVGGQETAAKVTQIKTRKVFYSFAVFVSEAVQCAVSTLGLRVYWPPRGEILPQKLGE